MSDQVDYSPGIEVGSRMVPVTPNDTVVQANRFIALHNATTTAGSIAITDQYNNAVTLWLVGGQTINCRPRLVKVAGTTVGTITGILQ